MGIYRNPITPVSDKGETISVTDKLTRNILVQLIKCRRENAKARLC